MAVIEDDGCWQLAMQVALLAAAGHAAGLCADP